MDESRKQFEEFIYSISNSDICREFILKKDESGNYTLPRTRDRWLFWQASRQTIEIDLPRSCSDDEYFIDGVFQPMRYERDAERAIFVVGLKIKGD